MNHQEAGRYWNDNADAWTRLARAGYDVYRDYLNTPAFFAMLPDVMELAGLEVGDYFRNLEGEVTEWLFGAAPPHAREGLAKFKTPRFTRTLSQWLNLLVATGFRLEQVGEPRPTDDTVRACPEMQDAQVVSYFLHLRVRKPGRASVE